MFFSLISLIIHPILGCRTINGVFWTGILLKLMTFVLISGKSIPIIFNILVLHEYKSNSAVDGVSGYIPLVILLYPSIKLFVIDD